MPNEIHPHRDSQLSLADLLPGDMRRQRSGQYQVIPKTLPAGTSRVRVAITSRTRIANAG